MPIYMNPNFLWVWMMISGWFYGKSHCNSLGWWFGALGWTKVDSYYKGGKSFGWDPWLHWNYVWYNMMCYKLELIWMILGVLYWIDRIMMVVNSYGLVVSLDEWFMVANTKEKVGSHSFDYMFLDLLVHQKGFYHPFVFGDEVCLYS